MSLYDEMQEAGVRIDQRDDGSIHVPINSVTINVIANYKPRMAVNRFINKDDGKWWFDIPFANKLKG